MFGLLVAGARNYRDRLTSALRAISSSRQQRAGTHPRQTFLKWALRHSQRAVGLQDAHPLFQKGLYQGMSGLVIPLPGTQGHPHERAFLVHEKAGGKRS